MNLQRFSRPFLLFVPAAAAAVLTLAAPAALPAQDTLSLTLEQSLKTGLENSKSLHASMMNVQGAEAKSGEAGAARLPMLRLGSSYTRLSDVPPAEIVIPQNFFGPGFPPQAATSVLSPSVLDNYNLRLSLQQPLFTGFRLQSSADVSARLAEAASRDYERDRSELIYNIKAAYWNLYKAIEFKKVIDENVGQMQAHLKDIRNMAAQGLVTKNEVLKVNVQLSNVQILQIDAANNVQLATIGLNNLIGIPLNTGVRLSSTIQPAGEKSYGGVNELIRSALDRRPEVQSAALRVQAGESAVTLARSGWFPQIYLNGTYYYARPNQRYFPAQDRFKDTWDVTLSVSMDIWNWGSTIHQTSQAQAQLAQARDGLGQLKDGISLEVTQNYLNFNQSAKRIGLAEEGVSQAEENLRITGEKFKSGLALNSDLLDAEVALLQAQWNRVQSLVDHALADAKLQKAIAIEGPAGN